LAVSVNAFNSGNAVALTRSSRSTRSPGRATLRTSLTKFSAFGRMFAPSSDRCSRARFCEGWLAAALVFFFVVEAWFAGVGKFL
jgi:hypothetical protein